MLRYYGRTRHIRWVWQAVDSRNCRPRWVVKIPARIRLIGLKSEVRSTSWSTSGRSVVHSRHRRNENDKWYATALVLSILAKRPTTTQHFCADKAYDSWDVHLFVQQQGYVPHIKHRRRRNEPKDPCLVPGEVQYPARRWVVERTLELACSASIDPHRWCKKPENWLALIQFASAHIVFDLAFFG